jgi:hypothetical protein
MIETDISKGVLRIMFSGIRFLGNSLVSVGIDGYQCGEQTDRCSELKTYLLLPCKIICSTCLSHFYVIPTTSNRMRSSISTVSKW